jgi:hypothetical protein
MKSNQEMVKSKPKSLKRHDLLSLDKLNLHNGAAAMLDSLLPNFDALGLFGAGGDQSLGAGPGI